MRKVGVFDSGLGGLTVARALSTRYPGLDLVYLGDTARLPYGAKSEETITRYALRCVRFLVEAGVDTVVVACNTASACAIPALRERFRDVLVLGVIDPGAATAVAASKSGAIGVIGTERTVQSASYVAAITALRPDARVSALACPLLVPLVEAGWIDHPVTRLTLETYLGDLLAQDPDIDTLVLGCTHYPVLEGVIPKVIERLRPGRPLRLVDSADAISDALAGSLDGLGHTVTGPRRFFVTDLPSSFSRVASTFWPGDLPVVGHVDLAADG